MFLVHPSVVLPRVARNFLVETMFIKLKNRTMLQVSASMLNRAAFNQGVNRHSADSIFLIDEQGRITFANSQAQKVFGFSSAELMGKRLPQAIHRLIKAGRSSPSSRRGSKRLLQSDPSVRVAENSFLHKNGSLVHGLCSEAPLEVQGRRLGAVLVIRDLTEQQWAEQARQETQLRLTALLDSAMDGILALDSEQRILTCNPVAEKMFRYTTGELLGKSVDCLLPQGLPRALFQPSSPREIAPQPGGSLGVLNALRSTGEEFPVEASISRVEMGSREFFSMTLRDISERKRVEQALVETQERLRQSQKMEAIGQLAGGVVHDFNNLLTVIGGHAELLLANLPPDVPWRESLLEIRSASSRAASLTRQLLAFGRKEVCGPKIVDLNNLIIDTEKMFRRLIGADVALQTVLAPDLHPVKVDPSQMDQVILNLVVNARDAMPKGGRLTIKTLNVELNETYAKTHPGVLAGSYVALVVHDTGCGMTPEVRARIFERFFTTKPAGRGTGLGLAVVDSILKQSGGHIAVQSEPGAGTTFKIYIPAARGRLVRESRTRLEANARGHETVLLVEDEDALRRFGAVVLERYGYSVMTAANGREALRLAERCREKLDLLLTDIVMPGISGCELATALRNRQPDLKVIFLSGYTEDTMLKRGILNRGAAFLSKPFSPGALATRVRQVLDGI